VAPVVAQARGVLPERAMDGPQGPDVAGAQGELVLPGVAGAQGELVLPDAAAARDAPVRLVAAEEPALA
jgi:hypothetical protein